MGKILPLLENSVLGMLTNVLHLETTPSPMSWAPFYVSGNNLRPSYRVLFLCGWTTKYLPSPAAARPPSDSV